jgi:hypothetical protein
VARLPREATRARMDALLYHALCALINWLLLALGAAF